ncbi:uncharacterized protein LOC135486700 [Lineus longissimus]|uniref:uncharacterized protein LOC135486700 n=1 Tax=Lineus longissimus TaxID=88925 RepID=UPI00315D4FA6
MVEEERNKRKRKMVNLLHQVINIMQTDIASESEDAANMPTRTDTMISSVLEHVENAETRPPAAARPADRLRRMPAAAAGSASTATGTATSTPSPTPRPRQSATREWPSTSSTIDSSARVTTTDFPSAIAEHRALFQPYPRRNTTATASASTSTSRYNRRHVGRQTSQERFTGTRVSQNERTIKRWFLCLHTTDACVVPTTTLKSQLYDSGLGEREVVFRMCDDAAAVKDSIFSTFPKLEQTGGFEVLKVKEGSRTCLDVIQVGSFPSAKLRSFGTSSSTKLYLRPLQRDITLDETASAAEDLEECVECGEYYPIAEMRSHKEDCMRYNVEFVEVPYATPTDDVLVFEEPILEPVQDSFGSADLTAAIGSIIDNITAEDPKAVLAEYTKAFLQGRPLDVDVERSLTMVGDVEEIFLDREEIFPTAFSELMRGHVNRRLPLRVNLLGEDVDDLGGPRREVLTLLHREVLNNFVANGSLVTNPAFVRQKKI